MARISALKQQQRRHSRVSVFLDGEYAFGLQKVLALSLRIGQELSEADIASLEKRDAAESAYERVLNYLSYRARSETEIVSYLGRKGVEDSITQQVLERLRRSKLVDDVEFARQWVENRETFRPRGRWALRAELSRKGVDREIIDQAVEAVDEEAGAMRVAERVDRRLANLDERTYRRRLLGYLQRRGFGMDVSLRIAERCWMEHHGEGATDPD